MAFVLIFFFLSLASFAQTTNNHFKHILILHSYNQGLKWTDNQDRGIRSVFSNRMFDVELHTEYMNTKLIADSAYFQALSEQIKRKYAALKFSAVIATDDDAFNFYIRYHQSLFPNVPMVFCGVNYLIDLKKQGYDSLATGVVEAFDVSSTLQTALKLHPKTTRVVVINDRSTTGKANNKVLQEVVPNFSNRVSFAFFEDFTMDQLLREVKKLKSTDLVLLLTFNRDEAGKVYSYDHSIALIAKAASVPIYGVWDFYLGSGIVGGMLTSGFDQGRIAGEKALRLIDGENIRNIPVERVSPNKFMFDYNYLQRFNIRNADLPKNSLIINEPLSFYEMNKNFVRSIIAGIVMLVIVILFMLRNIHLQKKSAAALRESEQRYDLAMLAVNDGIWDWNVAQNRVLYDSRYYTMAGYQPNEFPHHLDEWSKRVNPDDIDQCNAQIQAHLAGEISSFDIEFRFRKKDGNWMWIRSRGKSVEFDNKGQVVRMIGTHADVTDRKMVEEKLRESESKWRSYVENAPYGIFVFDSQQHNLSANPAASKITGYTEAELLTMHLSDLLLPDRLKTGQEQFEELEQKGISFAQVRFVTKKGLERWWYIAAKKISDDRFIGFCEDITERKQLELELLLHKENLEQLVKERTDELAKAVEELKISNTELHAQRKQLELTLQQLQDAQQQLIQSEKMASLGILTAGVAHEINNPINYIFNGAAVIEQVLKDKYEEEAKDLAPFFHAINTGVKRVTDIVKSMSMYSRNEKLPFAKCNMHEAIDNCLTILLGEYKHRIEIIKNFSSQIPFVYANEGKIHQALLNVLANAIQSIDDKGFITIQTSVTDNKWVTITITDTGKGIPDEEMKHIFDPFFTTKEPGKGTGLGLSITDKIISEHQGTITCESMLNKGTSFTIKLPFK